MAHVTRLKAAGFIVLGKTNTPEMGTTAFTDSKLNGPCRTPWDLERNAGGSSGGAAAALAAGLCGIAQGSDGGGSIRIPASCCGVLGFKASRGRISTAPFVPGIGLGTTGPARPHDRRRRRLPRRRLRLRVGRSHPRRPRPSGRLRKRSASSLARLRVALTTEAPIDAEVDPACVAAAHDAAELLSSLGHEVEEAAPDWGGPGLMDEFAAVWQTAPTMYPVSDTSVLMPLNRAFVEGALTTSSAVYAGSIARLQLRARKIASLWARFDLLLTPTLAQQPVPVGWESEPEDPWEQFNRAARFTPFTAAFNVTGQPAVSLPLHWTEEGLPIGAQLVGPPLGDALLLRVTSQLEAAQAVGESPTAALLEDEHKRKDVRDGDTAPRTPLCSNPDTRASHSQPMNC